MSGGEIINNIIGKWSESVNDEDNRVGMPVSELCIERDSLNELVFNKGESLILFICYISHCQHVFMYIILRYYFNVSAITMDV